MSVDMDEFAKQLNEEIKRESCEKGVPLFPTRFSIKEKHEKDIPSKLKHEYDTDIEKELTRSNYTLRVPREGYIYLYNKENGKKGLKVWKVLPDGQFQSLKILGEEDILKLASVVYGFKKGKYVNRGDITPFIVAPKESAEVYVSFSDTLWSTAISQDIVDKEDFRAKLMTKINVVDWQEDSASTDTFKMDDIDTLVEEYIDPENWKKKFSWASQDSRPESYSKKETLINRMKQVPQCEDKIIGVMLYDNIGLVEDLGSLIVKFQKEYVDYMQNEDRLHKKLISDFIEVAYQQEVAKNEEKPYLDVYNKDKKAWEKIKDGTYREDMAISGHGAKRLSPKSYAPYIQKQIKNKTFKSDKDFENELFSVYAPEKVKLINEEARQFFVKEYKKKSAELSKKIVEAKNDRYRHLSCFLEPSTPRHIGYSFLNYDLGYDLETETCKNGDESVIYSTYRFGQVFSKSIEGMMDEPKVVETVINKEHDLFAEFMETEKSSNPIWEIFLWSTENKVDSLAAIVFENDWIEGKKFYLNKDIEKANQELQIQKKEREKNKIDLKAKLKKELAKERKLTLEKNASTNAEFKMKKAEEIERVTEQRATTQKELKKNNQELQKLLKEMENPSSSKNYTKLQEQNKKLNHYTQNKMGRSIMQYTLNLGDLNAGARKKVFDKIERLLAENTSKFNLATFDMFENIDSVHAKRKTVEKIEMPKCIYDKTVISHFIELDGGKAYADNRTFAYTADKQKKALETKKFLLVIVDETELEELKTTIKELEKAYAQELTNNKNSYSEKKETLKKKKVTLEENYKQTLEQIEVSYDQKERERLEQNKKDLNNKLKRLEKELSQAIKEEKGGLKKAFLDKQEMLKKSFAPWVGVVDKLSGFGSLLLTGVNLWYAINAFKETNTGEQNVAAAFNFAGAVTGVLTSALAVKEFARVDVSALTLRATPKGVVYKMVLKKVFATKSSVVGLVAGAFDAITQWINADIQFKENNDKSAMAYVWAGALLLGGVVAGLAIAVAGSIFIVIGLILLSIAATAWGIIKLFDAQDLAWDSMDKWLSGCFFRMTEAWKEKDEDKYEDKTFAKGDDVIIYHKKVIVDIDDYNTDKLDDTQQEKEIEGFLVAYTEPKVKVDWSGSFGNMLSDGWDIATNNKQVEHVHYKGEDGKMHRKRSDNHGASVEIKLKFPMATALGNLRFGFNFGSSSKPSSSKELTELVNENTRVTVGTNELSIKFLHLKSNIEQMHFAFSWDGSYGKEQKRLGICYLIHDDDSLKKVR